MLLNDKKILITGASGGIGAALAIALAQQQCELVLVGRNQRKLQYVLDKVEDLSGRQHDFCVADLNKQQDRALLSRRYCDVDALVNCAGINCFSYLGDMNSEISEQIINTNITSTIALCQLFLTNLEQKPLQQIMNIGSVFGALGYPGYSVYCASKFALRGFTESLQRELADTRVKVLYVAPRTTDTTMNSSLVQQLNTQLGNKTDTPEWVARQIIKAMKNNCKRRTLGWPEKLFAKINQLFPAIVDYNLSNQLASIKQLTTK